MDLSIFERIGLGALLTAWIIYGANFFGDVLVKVEEPTHMAAVAPTEAPAEPAVPEPEVDFATVLAAADPAAGERVFNKCKACHGVDEGGPHKVGPNLHNIVGADIAAKDGFSYSGALEEVEGVWSYDELNAFLENPSNYAPGTKMTFAGLSKPEDRAEVILYLREQTANPPPLPEPEAHVAAAGPTTDAAGGEAGDEQQQAAEAAEEQPADAGEGAEKAGDDAASDQSDPTATEGAATEGTATEGTAGDGAPAEQDGAAGEGGLVAMIAAASPDEGQKVFRKCQACHTLDQGGPHRVGPNLYGVVGRDKASAEGYNYSGALSELEGEWTYQALDEYLADPRGYAPGTKMTFAGLKKEDERAAVIALMRQNTDSPPPLE